MYLAPARSVTASLADLTKVSQSALARVVEVMVGCARIESMVGYSIVLLA